MATITARLPRQLDYWSVGVTHFFVDFLNSGRNLIVALLALSLGLTNAQVGLALVIYNVGNALSQPIFGWLADKIGPRWLVIGGLGWMMFFSAVTAVASDWVALIAITVVGLGSGAFHPSGTKVATQAKTSHRTQATAVFFVFGQLGLFAGPVAAGAILGVWDRPGYLIMPAVAVIALFLSWQWVSNEAVDYQRPQKEETGAPPQTIAQNWGALALIGLILLGYSSASQSLAIYIPKLFAELEYNLVYVGWLAGIALIGGVVGGFVGGTLADVYHGRTVIFCALTIAAVPLYFAIPALGLLQMGLLLLAGFFLGMPHSILVIAIQNLLPGRRAFASGLALGFMFFSGSVGSYFVGVLGDYIGLSLALQCMAVLPVVAAVIVLLIPKEKIAPVID